MRLAIVVVPAPLFSVEPAWAHHAPKRKSGLWEITRTSTYTQNQPRQFRVCVDEASDNALQQLAEGMRGEACTTNKLSHMGSDGLVEPPPVQKGRPSTPDPSKDGKSVPGLGSLLRQSQPGQPSVYPAPSPKPVSPPSPSQ